MNFCFPFPDFLNIGYICIILDVTQKATMRTSTKSSFCPHSHYYKIFLEMVKWNVLLLQIRLENELTLSFINF